MCLIMYAIRFYVIVSRIRNELIFIVLIKFYFNVCEKNRNKHTTKRKQIIVFVKLSKDCCID